MRVQAKKVSYSLVDTEISWLHSINQKLQPIELIPIEDKFKVFLNIPNQSPQQSPCDLRAYLSPTLAFKHISSTR